MKILRKFFSLLILPLLLGIPYHVQNPAVETVYPIYEKLEEPEPDPPELTLLNEMTLEEKVGQLFIFGFYGTALNAELNKFVIEDYAGGLLILGRNIAGHSELKQLISDVQNISKIPLFISIDQEGGTVARLGGSSILTLPQSKMDTNEEAYEIAFERGKLLKEYGINVNFAPVVEYTTQSNAFMYQRVFRGSRDDIVSKSESAIRGYKDAGIVAVPKHFPGHGNTTLDPHFKVPKIDITETEWGDYIYTFENLIRQSNTEIIMVGHILFPNIDSNISTVSSKIITDSLKNQIGYSGIVLTDDMNMGAIDDKDGYVNIAKEAIKAGNDMLMYSKDITIQQEVYNGILKAVENGEILQDTIDESVLKILRVKIENGIIEPELTINQSPE